MFWRTILQFSREGKPLIVVDPRQTRTAAQATLWLPVRPGTDAFLALGLLHVILSEKLYDSWFVETWCHGFEQLQKHVVAYPPTWSRASPGSRLRKLSRLPGCMPRIRRPA